MFFSFSSFLINILIKRTSSLKSFSVTLTIFSSFRKYCTLKKQCSAWNFLFWKITKLPSPSNVLNNKDMKKTAFLYLIIISLEQKEGYSKPLCREIPHLEFHICGIGIIIQAVFV